MENVMGGGWHVKGSVNVILLAESDKTILIYKAKADVGGKLAQLGNRLVQGTAKNLQVNRSPRFEKFKASQMR